MTRARASTTPRSISSSLTAREKARAFSTVWILLYDKKTRKASVGFAFEVEAHDMQSLLFAFLDEFLFRSHASTTTAFFARAR